MRSRCCSLLSRGCVVVDGLARGCVSVGREHPGRLSRPDAVADHEDLGQLVHKDDRGQLKDAFGVVKALQEVLAQRYQAGRY